MADMPVGVDYAETAMFHALQEEGIKVVDGQQIMLAAREIKNWDEIQLLTQAASMVDGVYHMIYEELKPGVRENDIVALSNKMLYEMGSDDVEAINAISGERCNPHPHNFTDRYPPRRSGVLRHPAVLPGLPDLLLPHVQHRPRHQRAERRLCEGARVDRRLDRPDQARRHHRQGGAGLAKGRGKPRLFPSEDAAFGLQFGHGLGLALHERPIISRAVSLEHPMEIQTGMVFALETYCPAADGYSAARIEEEVVVTETGCEVIALPGRRAADRQPVLTGKRGAPAPRLGPELKDASPSRGRKHGQSQDQHRGLPADVPPDGPYPHLRGQRQPALPVRQDAGADAHVFRPGGRRRRHLRGADDDDRITSTHRGHGHCVAKGAEFKEMFCELLGKEEGYCRGKGGSMHIADQSHGNLGANAIVGGSMGIATGAALSAKLLGKDDVTVCFFGDGATAQGLWYEVMNMAALWNCRSSMPARTTAIPNTPRPRRSPPGSITARAEAFGIEATRSTGRTCWPSTT
jgi:putative hemolysin